MKVSVLLCLAFSFATALAENQPAESTDKSDAAKASAAFLAGDYDSAISLYTEVIKANPKAELAYNGRALSYRYKKDLPKALADFDQDAYFETDLLPVPPHLINPEAWSDPIEELVLFDFHFDGKPSEKSVTLHPSPTTQIPSFAVRSR